jgi:hypothetical protein
VRLQALAMTEHLMTIDCGTIRACASLIAEAGERAERRITCQGIQSFSAGGYPVGFEPVRR